MSKNYADYSFWLETCEDDLTPRRALDGPVRADVAVLGAGFTGLWTAYYLLRNDPSLRVVLLESEIAGFGASGRNGGWCTSGFSVSPAMLEERYGRQTARDLELAMFDTVDEVGCVCEVEGIDAHFRKGGALRIARGTGQIEANEHAYDAYRRLGLEDHCRPLDAAETAERIRVTRSQGSLFLDSCAAIHPARLVRGLTRAVERMGGTIYEQTPVTGWRTGSTRCLRTPYGDVEAGTVVLAGEAYLSRFSQFSRLLAPIYSLIVLTEPLLDSQWQEIGWQGAECVSSNHLVVDYLQRTADGRVLFGSRGEPYHWGSRIEDAYDRHEPTHRMIQKLVREWFPVLHDVRFTHHWGGPVAMPRDWMPTVDFDPALGIAGAYGYTGQGVATANLAGRMLADLIGERETALTSLPLVGHALRAWEPEPLRWMGIRYMQWAFERIDERSDRTGLPPTGWSMAERLGAH